MLAAHRGAADAAGVDWKSAVYWKVQEEVKADRGLTIVRMVELGRYSRRQSLRRDYRSCEIMLRTGRPGSTLLSPSAAARGDRAAG